MERLTASLEDGTLERLRTLAGGERKVGAYLSQVVAWLWDSKEDIDAAGLSGCVIVPREKISRFLGTDPETAWQRIESAIQKLEAEAQQEARAMRDAYAQLMVRTAQLEKQLEAQQEHSSQNDA